MTEIINCDRPFGLFLAEPELMPAEHETRAIYEDLATYQPMMVDLVSQYFRWGVNPDYGIIAKLECNQASQRISFEGTDQSISFERQTALINKTAQLLQAKFPYHPIIKSGRLHPFGLHIEPVGDSKEWILTERNRILEELDKFEEGQEDPALLMELERINEKVDAIRKRDYESGRQHSDSNLVELLKTTNEQLMIVFSRILDRLKTLDGEDNQTT